MAPLRWRGRRLGRAVEGPTRGKPLCGASIVGRGRMLGAGITVLAGLWLAGAAAPSAGATSCNNAQFRSGASEHLPDCRAYEEVSPVEKGGLDAVTLEPPFPAQASACEGGEACAIVYMNVGAAFGGMQGNDVPNAYLATREAGGWQTTALTPPSYGAPTDSKAKVAYAFSPSLSKVVLRVPGQQLTENTSPGVYNLFVQEVGGAYSLLTDTAPAPPPEAGCGNCFEDEDVPAFAGASSDFSHILFEANDSLIAGAPAGGIENLYEAAAGALRLVGILPDGTIAPGGAAAGGGIDAINEHTGELDHAISQDGSRVIFEADADAGGPEPQQVGETELYDRLDGSSTVEISAPSVGAQSSKCETEGGICNPEPAKFWAASANGSFVYFTSNAALTTGSYTGVEPTSGAAPRANPGNDLYRYDVDTGALTDLTDDVDHERDPNGASVLGVVGASEDGSYLYFVADGDLAAGAVPGEPNLYVWHATSVGAGAVSFISTLAAPNLEEERNIELTRFGLSYPYDSDIADWTSRPTESQAYVTPDGTHLAFMSVRPLTGYDNEDQETDQADHEVFEYSAETGRLACASCDAGDVRPRGSAFIGLKLDGRSSTAFHQPRSLSNDGSRLFFSSPDPLVSGLAGGSVKLFEYENGGVQLISGPESGGEAVFLDASGSGDDVFFATREQLALTDADELLDVYDARVDGGIPQPSVPVSSCQGGGCQEPFGGAPLFAPPVSTALAGSGNLVPSLPSTKKLTRKQLLARALAKCKRLRRKSKRAGCTDAAKRRYARRVRKPGRTVVPNRSRLRS